MRLVIFIASLLAPGENGKWYIGEERVKGFQIITHNPAI